MWQSLAALFFVCHTFSLLSFPEWWVDGSHTQRPFYLVFSKVTLKLLVTLPFSSFSECFFFFFKYLFRIMCIYIIKQRNLSLPKRRKEVKKEVKEKVGRTFLLVRCLIYLGFRVTSKSQSALR